MGIKDFFIALGGVIGWVLLTASLFVYISFREYFETLPKAIVTFGLIIVIVVGLILILLRNTSRVRKARKEGDSEEELERVVHISPMDDLKHDILAVLTFGAVIGWVLFSNYAINGTDIAQATIAFLAVMLVRRIYKEKIY